MRRLILRRGLIFLVFSVFLLAAVPNVRSWISYVVGYEDVQTIESINEIYGYKVSHPKSWAVFSSGTNVDSSDIVYKSFYSYDISNMKEEDIPADLVKIEVVVLPSDGKDLDSWLNQYLANSPFQLPIQSREEISVSGIRGIRLVKEIEPGNSYVVSFFKRRENVIVVNGPSLRFNTKLANFSVDNFEFISE